jgi:hypothetical protein
MNAIGKLKNKHILVGGIIFGTLASAGILAWGISQSNLRAKNQPATTSIPKPQPPKQ